MIHQNFNFIKCIIQNNMKHISWKKRLKNFSIATRKVNIDTLKILFFERLIRKSYFFWPTKKVETFKKLNLI